MQKSLPSHLCPRGCGAYVTLASARFMPRSAPRSQALQLDPKFRALATLTLFHIWWDGERTVGHDFHAHLVAAQAI